MDNILHPQLFDMVCGLLSPIHAFIAPYSFIVIMYSLSDARLYFDFFVKRTYIIIVFVLI